eukprot:SAG31_NODE_71_length_28115_cov_4.128105_2_plen_42_part_00
MGLFLGRGEVACMLGLYTDAEKNISNYANADSIVVPMMPQI